MQFALDRCVGPIIRPRGGSDRSDPAATTLSDLVPMRQRMRPATVGRQGAAEDLPKGRLRTPNPLIRPPAMWSATSDDGGKCERCGFSDGRALRLRHRVPLQGRRQGLSNKALSSTASHLAVLRGEKGLTLLCANCSCIAIAKDTTINANLTATSALTV